MTTRTWLILASMLVFGTAGTHNITVPQVFSSADAGEGTWIGNAACVEQGEQGGILITECANTGKYGDAYIRHQFPYDEKGVVELKILDVPKGKYTVQVLYFKAGEHFETRDLVKSTKRKGSRVYKLSALAGPKDADSIMFKIWVEGAKYAAVEVEDLVYYGTVASASPHD